MICAQTRILKNEKHKSLMDFEIQTDHLILVRRPDLGITIMKENLLYSGFAILADHRLKIQENEKRDKYLDIRELKSYGT